MKRRTPDPGQQLFPWAWADESDCRPDSPADDLDDDEPESPQLPPPLRSRVRSSHRAEATVLWGVPIDLGQSH